MPSTLSSWFYSVPEETIVSATKSSHAPSAQTEFQPSRIWAQIYLLVKGQNRASSASHLSRIDVINSASSGVNIPSIRPWSHCLVPSLIKISTLASAIDSTLEDWTCGMFFLGSRLSCQMFTAFPFPIIHWQPLRQDAIPRRCNLEKKRALKTLCNNEFRFFNNLHACLANKESLNIAISLNPIPPSIFDFVSSSHFTQWIFLFSPLSPPKFSDRGFNFMA